MKWFYLILMAALTAALSAADADKAPEHHAAPAHGTAAASKTKQVSVKEFEKLRADTNTVVLDVRTPREYASGHIPDSINIDVNADDFEKKVAALDKNKTYLVHCAHGGRGATACEKLTKLNFGSVFNLEGGQKAWEKAGNKPVK